MSICWQQNSVPRRSQIPQAATVLDQRIIMGNATYNPIIVPQESLVMLEIYQQPFGQPTSEHRTVFGNGLTEQSLYARNSDGVPQILMSYVTPTHEQSRYFQAQASSLGLGALAKEHLSIAVVGSVADQQLSQVFGCMLHQGIQATIHVR
ncbi:hypothetical protein BDV32DRAFT_4654 [Aspergillus pseudonomiae]|uniref:Uncharacterized protein n=1 Tax=Aspergillus pseudonomiae TaxID=1506151 RepID=A0A5N6IBA5_9EURO|nr:uncharacterized protein BDV37DRAFT_235274 [Aspergillus pseudonomiae]KAB8263337.1 hypothetical protein BDV32DRAFT_4654 [Aspergillus pseudonomiae]KAE8409878.1 hypothetical protein BDV37DRAFT_235274 [Aspergillus pseudonomiae]